MEKDDFVKDYIDSIKGVANAFRFTFKEGVDIKNVVVKGSERATSGLVYVPKRFVGKVATIIFWDKDLKQKDESED